MNYLTTILLIGGIVTVCYGINHNNRIMLIIGGICLGIYNSIYYHKIWRK